MNSEQFIYWLQGMLEYTDVSSLSPNDAKKKLDGIKQHLKLVFTKVTDKATKDTTSDKEKLERILKEMDKEAAKPNPFKIEPFKFPGDYVKPYDPTDQTDPRYYLERLPTNPGLPRYDGPIC